MLLQGIVVGAIWVYFIIKRRNQNNLRSRNNNRIIKISKEHPHIQERLIPPFSLQQTEKIRSPNIDRKLSIIPPLYKNNKKNENSPNIDMPVFLNKKQQDKPVLELFQCMNLDNLNLLKNEEIHLNDRIINISKRESEKQEWKPIIKFKKHKKITKNKYKKLGHKYVSNETLEAVSEVDESSKQQSAQTPLKQINPSLLKQVSSHKKSKVLYNKLRVKDQSLHLNRAEKHQNIFSHQNFGQQNKFIQEPTLTKKQQQSTMSEIYGEMYNPYNFQIDQLYD